MNYFSFFFFNDTATTEIYTLSLHDALPIFASTVVSVAPHECHNTRPPDDHRADTSASTESPPTSTTTRSEEHTSELQSQSNLVCRLLLENKKNPTTTQHTHPKTPCHLQ